MCGEGVAWLSGQVNFNIYLFYLYVSSHLQTGFYILLFVFQKKTGQDYEGSLTFLGDQGRISAQIQVVDTS